MGLPEKVHNLAAMSVPELETYWRRWKAQRCTMALSRNLHAYGKANDEVHRAWAALNNKNPDEAYVREMTLDCTFDGYLGGNMFAAHHKPPASTPREKHYLYHAHDTFEAFKLVIWPDGINLMTPSGKFIGPKFPTEESALQWAMQFLFFMLLWGRAEQDWKPDHTLSTGGTGIIHSSEDAMITKEEAMLLNEGFADEIEA